MSIRLKSLFLLLMGLAALVLAPVLPVLPVQAYHNYGFAPERYENDLTFGTGTYFAPYHVTLYHEPSTEAQPVEEITWDNADGRVYSTLHRRELPPSKPFIAFYPNLDVAMMAVVSDNGEGWAEVVYNQETGDTGWVQLGKPAAAETAEETPAHFGTFQTWLDFMQLNAKSSGIYWLTGVSDYYRGLRMKPEDQSGFIKTTFVRNIKVRHVRGNWMLVEILDFDRSTPIGWIRWRDQNGKFLVFANLSGARHPVITNGF